MDYGRKSSAILFLLAVSLTVFLLGGCGSSNEGTLSLSSMNTTTATVVGINTCTGCHSALAADWLTTNHANAEGGLNSAGSPSLGGNWVPSCGKCHDPNTDSAQVGASNGLLGTVARPVVGCEACHGGGSLHASSGGVNPISLLSNTTGRTWGTVPVSGQFVMCTSCHELLDKTTGALNTAPTHSTGTIPPIGLQYIITDTHYATPGNWPSNGAGDKDITGYSMYYNDPVAGYVSFDGDRVCVNCHNPHKPATQNREWAKSAHADKNSRNLNSTKTGYFSGAWAHYNWSTRPTCQRCHTTTGFSAYANALRSGDKASAQAIADGTLASSPVPSTAAWKPEMLKCNGCHIDNKGNLRNPGAITAIYDYVSGSKTYSKASHAYPDLAGSNVCMACHTGRENGDTIKGLNDPVLLSKGTISAFNFGNMGFINSHYLTAGGQLFTVTGYEFDGRPYNNISEFRHDKIGTTATQQMWPYADTGSNGPCIGCHMSRPNKNGNHLFLPVSRSATTYGEVTGIASEVCFNCHGPSTTLILDLVREQKKQFTEALEALKYQIEENLHIYFFPYSPYWYRTSYSDPKTDCNQNIPVKNWQTNGIEKTPTGDITSGCTYAGNGDGIPGTGKNNMGAAFNFNLLEHDPGAYVHNRMYTKRLIYDSIDWVDDGEMNYSVGDTLDAICSTGSPPPWCDEAITYLLPNGVLGIAAERP